MKDESKGVTLEIAMELLKQMLDDGEVTYTSVSIEDGEPTPVEHGFKHPQGKEAFLKAVRNDDMLQARLEQLLADEVDE